MTATARYSASSIAMCGRGTYYIRSAWRSLGTTMASGMTCLSSSQTRRRADKCGCQRRTNSCCKCGSTRNVKRASSREWRSCSVKCTSLRPRKRRKMHLQTTIHDLNMNKTGSPISAQTLFKRSSEASKSSARSSTRTTLRRRRRPSRSHPARGRLLPIISRTRHLCIPI